MASRSARARNTGIHGAVISTAPRVLAGGLLGARGRGEQHSGGHKEGDLRRSMERLKSGLAGLFAAPAGLRADPAVLVLARVTLAFLGAEAAGLLTRAQNALDDRLVGACPPRSDVPGRRTDVGAVQVQTDALGELCDHLLAQAGVGTRGAGLSAVEARFDAPDKAVIGVAADVRVRTDHLVGVHSRPPYAGGWPVNWSTEPRFRLGNQSDYLPARLREMSSARVFRRI
jgi:hypothetical protein